MKKFIAALALLCLTGPAFAACPVTSFTVVDGASATKIFCVDNDGGTNLFSATVIRGGANNANAVSVSASNALKVDGSAVTQPVSLSGNQAINVVQLAGTAVDVNSGNKSSGSQRFVLATDQLALPTWGHGATGAAVPSGATYQGINVGGNNTGIQGCGSSVVYDASTSGSTQLVALQSGQTIYICGYSIWSSGTVKVELDYGTGSACATGTTKIVPAWDMLAQTAIADGSAFYRGLKTASANELCIKTNGAVGVQAIVYYDQHA